MKLADHFVRTLPKLDIRARLVRDDQDVDEIGVGTWHLEESRASVGLTFGPFTQRTSFDAVEFDIEGERNAERVDLGTSEIAPGIELVLDLQVSVPRRE